jgi:hypothetical protein
MDSIANHTYEREVLRDKSTCTVQGLRNAKMAQRVIMLHRIMMFMNNRRKFVNGKQKEIFNLIYK